MDSGRAGPVSRRTAPLEQVRAPEKTDYLKHSIVKEWIPASAHPERQRRHPKASRRGGTGSSCINSSHKRPWIHLSPVLVDRSILAKDCDERTEPFGLVRPGLGTDDLAANNRVLLFPRAASGHHVRLDFREGSRLGARLERTGGRENQGPVADMRNGLVGLNKVIYNAWHGRIVAEILGRTTTRHNKCRIALRLDILQCTAKTTMKKKRKKSVNTESSQVRV